MARRSDAGDESPDPGGPIGDEAHRAALLPDLIEEALQRIRTFEEMRALTVRPPSPAPLAPEPALEAATA